MLRFSCIFFFVLVVSGWASAQEKPIPQKLKLQSVINIGFLNGSKGSSLALQAMAGGAVNQSFAGIGVGLDYYGFRSIPLFLHLRQEFGKGTRNIFAYGDVGYNSDWLSDKDLEKTPFFGEYNFRGGMYYEGGLGYSFKLDNTNAIMFSFGYSFKHLSSTLGNFVCPGGPCYNDKERYAYSMSRWMIKAGWRF